MQSPRNEAPYNAAHWPITFVSKSLSNKESPFSNIESKALGILHGLEEIHHYCFTHKVSMITDHKPLVAIFKKDVVSLSHWLPKILLCIH